MMQDTTSRQALTDIKDSELLRYSRQIMLPAFDVAGQLKLLNARVLIVGLGGLGSPAALYLAAAGVGRLVLADHDVVELSNLQRQIAHDESRLGLTKVDSAASAISQLNAGVAVECIAQKLSGEVLQQAVSEADLVLDCSDNFASRFEINACCVALQTPLVSGAAIRMEGQITAFDPRDSNSPCYRCLYPEGEDESLSCSEAGVMAPLVGVVGSMQALEAIKLLSGLGQPLVGRLLVFDAMYTEWRQLSLSKDPACPCCGTQAGE